MDLILPDWAFFLSLGASLGALFITIGWVIHFSLLDNKK